MHVHVNYHYDPLFSRWMLSAAAAGFEFKRKSLKSFDRQSWRDCPHAPTAIMTLVVCDCRTCLSVSDATFPTIHKGSRPTCSSKTVLRIVKVTRQIRSMTRKKSQIRCLKVPMSNAAGLTNHLHATRTRLVDHCSKLWAREPAERTADRSLLMSA